jgi:hypothetical protein
MPLLLNCRRGISPLTAQFKWSSRYSCHKETTKQPDAPDKPVANPSPTTPSTTSPASSTSGSSGITGVSFYPPYGPHTFSTVRIIAAREFQGVFLKADPDHHVITAKLLAICTRAAICGVFCPGGLLCPWPGQYAHQEVVTSREGGVLGIALGGCFTPDSGPSLVVKSGNWMTVMF